MDLKKTALIIVDVQNDFLPGGALGVPEGDAVISIANTLTDRIPLVVATQDWHPPNHLSFAANHDGRRVGDVERVNGQEQILWPVHCVQETPGAALSSELLVDRIERIFRKGMDPVIDSYSGFVDNDGESETGLAAYLAERNVSTVVIVGLATDYCVKFTAMDARRRYGLETYVVLDGIRGVNAKPGDVDLALRRMKAAGVNVVAIREL